MILKTVFGKPFNTDAVVNKVPEKDTTYFSELQEQIIIPMEEESVIYGFGQAMGNINKRGRIYTSYCSDDPSHTENKESLYGAHNFFIIHNPSNPETDKGYFFDYPGKITFDVGFTNIHKIVITTENDFSYYVIDSKESPLSANPLISIVTQFRHLIGQSYIPPRWAFGYMQSRWGYKTESDVRKVYESYKKEGIPLDSICLDIDYMKDFKDFTVDKEKFPDLEKFSAELKAQGVRLVPIIDAGVKIQEGYDVYEEGVKNNFFCKKADGENFVAGVWPGRTHFPDFLQPEARRWFGQKYKVLTDMGIEGFWNDMNEPAIFYSDEGLEEVLTKIKSVDTSNLDINSFFAFKDLVGSFSNSQADYNRFYHKVGNSTGSLKPASNNDYVKHNDIHNLYGYNMTRSAGEELAKIREGKRTLLFSRASYIGMHRYGGIWTGDNCSWWEHLALEIKMMPGLNMCGFLYTGADIGGFGCNASRELLLRWLSFGIFTPLMRNHAALGTREQECYQFERTSDFKDVISIRYQLLPYLYSEYMKAALTDKMYFRPLSFDYTDPVEDSRCLEIDDQLMLGNDVMVAPVCKQNAKGRVVYIPEDMIQVRFKSGSSNEKDSPSISLLKNSIIETTPVTKGDHYIEVPLNEVVIFIKKGHVIPVANAAMNTDTIDYENLKLIGNVTPDSFYELYTDDGYTTDYSMEKNIKIIK